MGIRDIKFKGKRLDNGEWMYGDLLHLVDGVYISNDNGCNMAQVHPDTVGQYTGLKDKNGKEIYEDDIIGACGYLSRIVTYRNDYGGFFLRIASDNEPGKTPLGRIINEVPFAVTDNIYDEQKGG